MTLPSVGPAPEALWRGLRSHGTPSGRAERNGEGGGERRLVHLRRLGLGLLPADDGLFARDGSRHLAGVWHGALVPPGPVGWEKVGKHVNQQSSRKWHILK